MNISNVKRTVCSEVKRVLSRKILIYFVVGWIVGFLMSKLDVSNWFINESNSPQDFNSFLYSRQILDMQKHYTVNATLANQLYKDVRILCWIMTSPKNHEDKAFHVKRTWGSRCNKLIFMSSAVNRELGAIALPVSEGRANLWGKTKEAFKYIHKNHLNDADWFLKADDDTYVIVENLRYMLYPYDTNSPLYFGCRYKSYVKQGYMSGGAGYVLSRESVRRFVENAIPDPKLCKKSNRGVEDLELGICLENVGVMPADSRDSYNRSRFFPFPWNDHFIDFRKKLWFYRYNFYDSDAIVDCCSDYGISFHYISPNQMYQLEYFVYHLRPYGIFEISPILPSPNNTNLSHSKNKN